MRFLSFYIFLAVVAVIAAVPINLKDEPQSLFDVDVQGHANVGDRGARGQGNYLGGYGGIPVGYGGYSSGGYGGIPIVYSGYSSGGYGGYGGYGRYGGYGGNHGGYYL